MDRFKFFVVAMLVFGAPQVASAQGLLPWNWFERTPPTEFCGDGTTISPICRQELDSFQKEEKHWREVKSIWANYPTYHMVRTPLGGPHPVRRPLPPLWLLDRCNEQILAHVWDMGPECTILQDYIAYDWTAHILGPSHRFAYSTTATIRMQDGNKVKEFLLKNLHFDGPWTNSSNGPRITGYFGSHLTMARAGRLWLWGAPGYLIYKTPDKRIHVEMSYGVDIFVGDIPIGGVKVPVFFTAAKVLKKGEMRAIKSGVNAGTDMIGLSITFPRW